MELTQKQSQKLSMTAAMLQSLELLQLPVCELASRLQDAALSNPLLEVELPGVGTLAEEGHTVLRESSRWNNLPSSRGDDNSLENLAGAHTETFSEHLAAQLRQSRLLKPGPFLRLCLYLTDCLDERGYLTIPLEELAAEQGCTAAEAEQALFAIQMLDPPGVGARDLTECLILQLAQSPDFNALTVRMARDGLEALAARNYAELSRRFHASEAEVRRASAVLLSLNPIPAAGFGAAAPTLYAVPDAVVHIEGETVVMELNERALPRLTVDRSYATALQESGDSSVRTYVREKLTEANALSGALQARRDTLTALLAALVDLQGDYFRSGTLRPLTMGEMAERLGVSVSTVSRAVNEKLVEFRGRSIPLRTFFPAALTVGGAVAGETVRQKLAWFVSREDPAAPLSDEALRLALSAAGLDVSRRTVAKYRAQLGIAAANQRRSK